LGANETITPAALTVTASNATKTYGMNDPTLAYTTAGLVSGTVQSRDSSGALVHVALNDTATNVLTGNLERATGETAGNYAITSGSLASNSNYALKVVGNWLTIAPSADPGQAWATIATPVDRSKALPLLVRPGPRAMMGTPPVDPMFELTNRGWVAVDDRNADLSAMELMTLGYLPKSLIQGSNGLVTWNIVSTGVHLPSAESGVVPQRL
jgi:hypothetical protein